MPQFAKIDQSLATLLGETTVDPWFDDPFSDYDTEPVMAFSAT